MVGNKENGLLYSRITLNISSLSRETEKERNLIIAKLMAKLTLKWVMEYVE